MRRVAAEIGRQIRMRRERLGVFFEALLVDRQVARPAPIHLRHADEIHVVDDVGQDHLLDLEGRRHEIEQRRVEEVVLRQRSAPDGVEQLAAAGSPRRAGRRSAWRRSRPGRCTRPAPSGAAARSAVSFWTSRSSSVSRFSSSATASPFLAALGRSAGAQRLELVAVVIVGRLGVLVVALGAVQPDVDRRRPCPAARRPSAGWRRRSCCAASSCACSCASLFLSTAPGRLAVLRLRHLVLQLARTAAACSSSRGRSRPRPSRRPRGTGTDWTPRRRRSGSRCCTRAQRPSFQP